MTTHIFAYNSVSDTVRAELKDYDDLFIAAGVTVGNTEGIGINSVATDGLSRYHRATIDGNLIGNMAALILGTASTDSFQELYIRKTGQLMGHNGNGVALFGANSHVENAGYIYGQSNGLVLAGSQSTDFTYTTEVLNSGTIESEFRAVIRGTIYDTETINFTNTGTIKGQEASYFTGAGGIGIDNIVNSGRMIGAIKLDGGADFYDGRDGQVIGTIYGGGGADTIYGGAEANVIDGGTEADIMKGGKGDDIYFVDNVGDKVYELNETGVDEVRTSVPFSLGSQYIEKLTLYGASAISGTGNSLANTLDSFQNKSANTLTGGNGNDTYLVGDNDRVVEASGSTAGTADVVKFTGSAGKTFDLGSQYIERLELLGTEATNGRGNSQVNTIIGNEAANTIAGEGGNDKLTGGAGADTFLFDSALSSTTNVDTITDYVVADDTIQLSNDVFTVLTTTGKLTGSAFYASTSGVAHDSNDRIIYETDTGKLFYDSNGNAAGGAVQFALLAKGLSLGSADFFIV